MRPPDAASEPLERLMAAISQSARYRCLCPDVIRRIGAAELAKRKSWKEAEKETRNRLHQIGGAYLQSQPPYSRWLETLSEAPDSETYRTELKRMMLCHASTRERLPLLDTFYRRTLDNVRPIHSILDVACGFNALALPWMGLEEEGRYHGFDLYSDMAAFLEEALRSSEFAHQCDARVETGDLAAAPPDVEADVALVLKFLPLLEQPNAQHMLEWLQRLRTRYVLVSFPTRTLGGRNVGMASSYDGRFREVLQQAGWSAERYEFDNELCFLVQISGTV